jgi:hypothetical protein
MLFILPGIATAYDVTEKLSFEGTLTGVYQYGDFDVEGDWTMPTEELSSLTWA